MYDSDEIEIRKLDKEAIDRLFASGELSALFAVSKSNNPLLFVRDPKDIEREEKDIPDKFPDGTVLFGAFPGTRSNRFCIHCEIKGGRLVCKRIC